MRTFHRTILAAAVAVACAGAAFAAPMSTMPPESRQGAVTFVTGGVGELRAQAFERAAGKYPLALEFIRAAKPRDEFLADVAVTITDASGTAVLTTTAEGPFLLAKLPPGEYQVSATFERSTQERAVKIGDTGHRRIVFEWPAA